MPTIKPIIQNIAPKGRRRGHKRRLPVEKRAYYTRDEVCMRFGLSAKRLAEAVATDETLPIVRNGRSQLFPKGKIEAWFEAAAEIRQNMHAG